MPEVFLLEPITRDRFVAWKNSYHCEGIQCWESGHLVALSRFLAPKKGRGQTGTTTGKGVWRKRERDGSEQG